MPKPYKRKLGNYLLDKSLQLRYVAFVTLLSAAIAGTLGYLIWRQEADASAHVLEAYDGLGIDDPELRAEIIDRTSTDDNTLVLTMAGAGLGLMGVLFLYLVLMTHKVAGPLYKMSRYFDEMAAGRLGQVYSLRKGDMLQDFYDKFRETHEALRAHQRADAEAVTCFLASCEAAGVTDAGVVGQELDELRAHVKRREEALG